MPRAIRPEACPRGAAAAGGARGAAKRGTGNDMAQRVGRIRRASRGASPGWTRRARRRQDNVGVGAPRREAFSIVLLTFAQGQKSPRRERRVVPGPLRVGIAGGGLGGPAAAAALARAGVEPTVFERQEKIGREGSALFIAAN